MIFRGLSCYVADRQGQDCRPGAGKRSSDLRLHKSELNDTVTTSQVSKQDYKTARTQDRNTAIPQYRNRFSLSHPTALDLCSLHLHEARRRHRRFPETTERARSSRASRCFRFKIKRPQRVMRGERRTLSVASHARPVYPRKWEKIIIARRPGAALTSRIGQKLSRPSLDKNSCGMYLSMSRYALQLQTGQGRW